GYPPANVVAVSLGRFAAEHAAELDLALDVREVVLAEVDITAHVAAALVIRQVAQAGGVLEVVAAPAGVVGVVLANVHGNATGPAVVEAHVSADGQVDVFAGGARRAA